MLTVTHPAPNRIDIELTAVLDGDMMAAALDELVEAAKDIEEGVMLYRVISFSWPTGGAILAEVLRLPQLFRMIGHFKRCAVVSDMGWIRTAAEIEGKMIPGLEIKAFEPAQEPAAERWLSETGEGFHDNIPV